MKARTLVVLVAAALTLLFPATQGFVAEWHEVLEMVGTHGSINWSQGIITAMGIGMPPENYHGKPQTSPMTLTAAQLDAYRNLLEVAKGVRIDSIGMEGMQMHEVITKLRLKMALQHRLNPLHVYCRLAPIVGRPKAMSFAHKYEQYFRKIL